METGTGGATISVFWLLTSLLILVLAYAAIQYLIRPMIVLHFKRKDARDRVPQPQQIWVQDDGLLYITEVNASGVEMFAVDGSTGKIDKWKDTWEEWKIRVRLRTVYFTGHSRPLGDA